MIGIYRSYGGMFCALVGEISGSIFSHGVDICQPWDPYSPFRRSSLPSVSFDRRAQAQSLASSIYMLWLGSTNQSQCPLPRIDVQF
jgi:hypothetical protein